MDETRLDDSALIGALRAGDDRALEALVARHMPAVWAHSLRFFGDPASADDAVQEVFLKVYRSLSTFDDRAKFSTWLYRVTRNVCLDMARAGARRPAPADPFFLDAGSVPDLAEGVALSVSLEAALGALAPEDRDAFSAVALFDLSYAEAAEALAIPAGTVKSRVFRARRTLASALGLGEGAR